MKKYILFLFFVIYSQSLFSKTWEIGASRTYKLPSQVSNLVADGDTVAIDADTYQGDVSYWKANDLVLRGVGGKAHLKANGKSYGGKAIWVIAGNNVTVENIEFSDCKVPDKNGAGIRHEGKKLIVRNCYFHHNEMGILTHNSKPCTVIIEYCEFAYSGYGDGYSHNVYIGRIDTLIFRYNYSHHAKVGHELKSRAQTNYILYNRLSNESGNASRTIDLPNGGTSYVIGNIIEQGPNAENSNMVGYGLEGLANQAPHRVYFINNTFVNNKQTGTFLDFNTQTDSVLAYNNIFAGAGSLIYRSPQSIDTTANLRLTNINDLHFENANNYDYRLTKSSQLAINKGITINNNALVPQKHYVHPTSCEDRYLDDSIDIGAYEYPAPPSKTHVMSIKRANNAAEYTNADTVTFTVTLEQNAKYTPIPADFTVTYGEIIADNPISGNETEWNIIVVTNESSGYDTAKTVSLEVSNTSKLKSSNTVVESYSVRKKFAAKVEFMSPTNTDVCLNDSGKVVFNEDGIIMNANINSPIIITGGNGHALVNSWIIEDNSPNDHKTKLIFTYSNITNATTYILSFTENAFKDMWGNLSGKLDEEVKFNTVKAFVESIERLQPSVERTNADTVTFKLTLEKIVNCTPEKSDFLFNNCDLVQNNAITGAGSEWQIKVLTNAAEGYDSAKLVTIYLLPEGNLYSFKSFTPQNYSVRKKFNTQAVLKSPAGDSVAITGTDGKIIFAENGIKLNANIPTLSLIGGLGSVGSFKILEKNDTTFLLFNYSDLLNSTQYSLEFSDNALLDSWGNLSDKLPLLSNVFTTCKKVGINSDLTLSSLSNQPNPFTQTTVITWSSSIAADTKIIVFDVTGKLVRILLDEYRLAGEHSLIFDSKGLDAGIYYYQIQIGDAVSTKKMLYTSGAY